MGKRERYFRFKKFGVSHARSSMPIGVDGVLVAAWGCAMLPSGTAPRRILDIGTGCGIISLICAQRIAEAEIVAIDIDKDSIEEAQDNFDNSPWSDRLEALNVSLQDYCVLGQEAEFDLIITNPPYFISGMKDLSTSREKARHTESLPFEALLEGCDRLMSKEGRMAVILPTGPVAERFIEIAEQVGLTPVKRCLVYGNSSVESKRTLLMLGRAPASGSDDSRLILEKSRNLPTDEYKDLCSDLYLKF